MELYVGMDVSLKETSTRLPVSPFGLFSGSMSVDRSFLVRMTKPPLMPSRYSASRFSDQLA